MGLRSVVSNSLQPHGLYSFHGLYRILQARILEWVAFPFSRRSSQPSDRTQISHVVGGFFTSWATREAPKYWSMETGLLHCRRILYQLSYQGSLMGLRESGLFGKAPQRFLNHGTLSGLASWQICIPEGQNKHAASQSFTVEDSASELKGVATKIRSTVAKHWFAVISWPYSGGLCVLYLFTY